MGGLSETEERRKPTLANQLFVVLLSSAAVGALTAGGNAWVNVIQLDGLVKSIAADHGQDNLRIEKQLEVIRQELRTAESRWHTCVERTGRLENYVDFVLRGKVGSE